MKTGKVLLLAVVIGILLAGCEDRTSDGVLRMGLATAPRGLDPRFATDATSERINRLLYRRLVEFDTASRPVPALATWEQLTPTRYLFTLGEQGRVFSDGSRLDAEDVKATYASILDPAGTSPHRALLSIIRDIRTDGPDRVEFRLSAPDPLFPAYLGIGILPSALIRSDHGFQRAPVGSGPPCTLR